MSKLDRRRAVILFGEFEADLGLRKLLKQGQGVDIQEKPFEMLAVLLERPGEIVSREELHQRLWLGVHSGDLDHNLDVCVGKLRHALSDPANCPRFIKTISTRGYCFIAPVKGEEAQPSKQPGDRIRIAVLPLALDTSKSPGEPCDFCVMLAAEISIALAQRYPDQLGVIAHSSVLKYRGTAKNPAQIGRELRADYLLEITCRTVGDSYHIVAQLIQAKDQTSLWAERYNYNSANPFTIQQEVAERMARSLGLKLLPAQSVKTVQYGTPHPEANLLYLKGCHQQWEQTEENLMKSIESFEQAIQLAPQYAMAYSALANSYSTVGRLGFAGPPGQWFPKAVGAAQTALEINDNLAGPYVSKAIPKYLYEWDWEESERLLRRALELNPSDSFAHRTLGYLFSSRRRHEEAIAEARQACELNPVSLSANVCLGVAYYSARQYEEAIATLQATLDVKPTFSPALMWLGACYTMLSKHAEAIAALEAAREHLPHPLVEGSLGSAYARAGRKKQAKAVLAELACLATKKYISSFGFALIYAGLDQIDQALERLSKAREERCPFFAVFLPVDPRLDVLRSDPRYPALADCLPKA